MKINHLSYILIINLLLQGCGQSYDTKQSLEVVTYQHFEKFVAETGYITDAEKYGWSIVQQDVYNYITVENATWKKPDGINPPKSKKLPVTQVSYNDAITYCKWAGKTLPTYEQYWELVKNDDRVIVSDNKLPISDSESVNIVGNVWDITTSEKGENIRLAGGSLFCSKTTCHGTSKEREMYVDKVTGNMNIGFAVVNGD